MAQTLTQDDLDAIAAAVKAVLNNLSAQGVRDAMALPLTPETSMPEGSIDYFRVVTDLTLIDIVEDTGTTLPASIAAVSSLTAQEVRDALKLAPSAGDPAAGSIDAHLDAVQAKTDLISPSGEITVVSPVDVSGDVTIDAGYDYYAVDGRALIWTDATPATWPNLTGATAVLHVGALSITGSITNPTGPATMTFELSRAQTAALGAGVFSFHIDCTLANTHLILQVRGTMTVS